MNPNLKLILSLSFSLLAGDWIPATQAECPYRRSVPARVQTSPELEKVRGTQVGYAKIVVPFDATVSVDGRKLEGRGPVRWYRRTPGDEPQLVTIRGTWRDRVDGQSNEYVRNILVQSGRVRPVNLCGDSLAQITGRVVDRSNLYRARVGAKPLTQNAQLSAAAQKHAENMASQNRLAHQLDGKGFLERSQGEGYTFLTGGENIAEGAWSSSHVVEMWMRSPGHRRNLLSSGYSEIGVGTAWAEDGTRYDVQVFGRPASLKRNCQNCLSQALKNDSLTQYAKAR